MVATEQTLTEAFIAYAQNHHPSYPKSVVEASLNDAGEFCNLHHSILGE